MGSVTYNFLAHSILLDQKNIENGFKDVPLSRLEIELQSYREHCVKNYNELIGEINPDNKSLSVFTSAKETPIQILKQTALYLDQFIVSDPLFRLSYVKDEFSGVTAKYLGYENNSLSKESLTKAARFLRDLTPMIAGDFVKIFPLSYLFENPFDGLPIYLPENLNSNLLPKEILNFFWDNVELKALKKANNGGWNIEKKLYPSRGIIVDFKGAESTASYLYHLFETELLELNEKTREVQLRFTIPDTPPHEEEFNAWVTQSINSSAKNYFDQAFAENYIAAKLNCNYMCSSEFTASLISRSFLVSDNGKIENYTSNAMINLELPFVENIDIMKLMEVRKYDGDVFENFRVELEKNMRELRSITDEKLVKLKIENMFHEFNSVQVLKIKQKIKLFRKQMGVSATVALGGLAGSVSSGGYSLIAAAAALAKGYKDYLDYREKVIENPSFLLWKVSKNNKKR